MKRVCSVVVVCVLVLCAAPRAAVAYGFYMYGYGRQDFATANRYDLPGVAFPARAGNPVVYDFGQAGGFDTAALPFLRDNAAAAVQAAFQDWGQWAAVKVDSTLGASNTGLVRLRYNPVVDGALTRGYGAEGDYAVIEFGQIADVRSNAGWSLDNFNWIMRHEVGHVLGIRDLYDDGCGSLPEDFVDHRTRSRTGADDCNGCPCRDTAPCNDKESLVDNIMYSYRHDGNNYNKTPETIIDNDEIAAATWLWGGYQHQIVTGDLGPWSKGRRGAEVAHGDQDNPLTWWDYRGTISWGGAGRPRISLEFVGYETFIMNSFPSAQWIHIDGGGDVHIFECQDPSWSGNYDLWVKSAYSKERRIWASVFGGGRTDLFDLDPVTRGLAHETGPLSTAWAMPFGPMVPEPSSLLALGGGVLGLLGMIRRRSG